MRLNIGSGMLPMSEWVNVDIREDWDGVDIVADARDLNMFEDESADEVFAKDVLEHMPRNEWRKALAEWCRVLKPGGLLKIRFPDALMLYEAYMNGSFDPHKIYGEKYSASEYESKRWAFERFGQLLFGDQNVPENAHLSCLSNWLVRHELEELGMKVLNEWKDGKADVRFTASKGEPDQSISLDHPDYAYR